MVQRYKLREGVTRYKRGAAYVIICKPMICASSSYDLHIVILWIMNSNPIVYKVQSTIFKKGRASVFHLKFIQHTLATLTHTHQVSHQVSTNALCQRSQPVDCGNLFECNGLYALTRDIFFQKKVSKYHF